MKILIKLSLILSILVLITSCSSDDSCQMKASKTAVTIKASSTIVSNFANVTLTEDTIYTSDTTITGNLDLNGWNLTVMGSLTVMSNLQGGGIVTADNVIVYGNINSGVYEMTIVGSCLAVGGNLNSALVINGGNYYVSGTTPGSGSITGSSTENMACEITTLGVPDYDYAESVVVPCEWDGQTINGFTYRRIL